MSSGFGVDDRQCRTRYGLLPVGLAPDEVGKSLLLGCVGIFWLRACLLPFRLGVRDRSVSLVSVIKVIQFQDCAVFQLEQLTKTAIGNRVEDRNLGTTTSRGGILRKGVTRREDEINPDAALGSIAVVLEFQSVSVRVLFGVRVICCGRSERGESEAWPLEIDKSLKSSRWLGGLVQSSVLETNG